MKRIMTTMFCVCMAVIMVFLFCGTADAATDGIYTYEVSDGEATITGCDSLVIGSITIPSTLGGYPVTSIGDWAFSDCSKLTSITISNGVTNIGYRAFNGCNSLMSISIPYSVTSIGDALFTGCSSLTAIEVSTENPNYSSQDGVLFNKNATELIRCPIGRSGSYVIPNGVTSVGDSAFASCSSLKNITISNSVTSIGDCAFSDCSSLTGITIPNGVSSIGAMAFEGCSSLASIIIPDGVSSIGAMAFESCSSLASIIIPDGVSSIGDRAFYGCGSMTCITIPNSVTSIGNSAFYGCSNLTDITIPNSVTSIGNYAFVNCSSLASITIPDSVTSIGTSMFSGCTGLTDITISKSVECIGYYAFWHCSSLTNITIPNSVICINDDAFNGCSSLIAVRFDGAAPEIGENVFKVWDSEAREYVNIPGLTLYYYEGMKGWTTPTWNGYPTALRENEHQHSYTAIVTPPSCTQSGYTTHVCTICGDSYADSYVNALGHRFGLWVSNGDATEEKDGTKTRTCSVCGFTETETDAGSMLPVTPWVNPFTDVKESAWYYDSVSFAATRGLFNGTSATTFGPNDKMTRAMFVTVLYRLDGSPAIDGSTHFTDVPSEAYFYNAVKWANANGIVYGTAADKFSPNANVTREQMMTFLYRYANYKDVNTTHEGSLVDFPDAGEVSSYALHAMAWSVGADVIHGSDGMLLPSGTATRAEVATMLKNYVLCVIEK